MLPPCGQSLELRPTPDMKPKRSSQREPEVTHSQLDAGQRFPRKLCWTVDLPFTPVFGIFPPA